MSSRVKIIVDDLSGPQIAVFLAEHLDDMRAVSPPESKHALDLDGLRRPEVTFWSVLDGETVIGCGALKELDPRHAEIKSMRTASPHRRSGVATQLLEHLVTQARARGYEQLSLETGTGDFFAPARRLYQTFGFEYCEPFGDYQKDPHSVHLTKNLRIEGE